MTDAIPPLATRNADRVNFSLCERTGRLCPENILCRRTISGVSW